MSSPHDWDSEMELLGRLVRGGDVEAAAEHLRAEDFGKPAHQMIYAAILAAAKDGEKVSAPRLFRRLRDQGQADAIGGYTYLTALDARADAPGTEGTAARSIAKDARRRRAIELAHALVTKIEADPTAEPSALLAELSSTIDAGHATPKDAWISVGQAADLALADLHKRIQEPGTMAGIPTGWADLDQILGGWQGGKSYVLAARPKMGKTLAAWQSAIHAATLGFGVGKVSLEMGAGELGERALSQTAHVDAGRMAHAEINDDEWRRLLAASEDLQGLPLYIADAPAQDIGQIRARAKALDRSLRAVGKRLDMLVIDYLQLMGGDGGKNSNREQVVAAISRGVKLLAKEMNIPILILAQLSRKCEERTNKRPMPSDLRESGAIEQDADAVIFLYRDEVYNDDSPDKGVCEVIVSIIRRGKPGVVKLAYIGNEYRLAPLDAYRTPLPPDTRRRYTTDEDYQ